MRYQCLEVYLLVVRRTRVSLCHSSTEERKMHIKNYNQSGVNLLCIYVNIKSLPVHYMFTPSLREEEVGCCTVTVTDSTPSTSVSVVVLSKVRFTMTALEGL